MFFGRLDYQDKNKRLKDKTMEFIWKGSPNLGNDWNINFKFRERTFSDHTCDSHSKT